MTAPPQHCPSPRELDDLELIAYGALGGRQGFGGADDLVQLVVPASVAAALGRDGLELVDPEGTALAHLTVEDRFDAEQGTGLAGAVESRGHHVFGAFRRLYLSPAQVHEMYGEDTLTIPVAGPLTSADIEGITDRAQNRQVVLLALVGHGTPSFEGRPLSATGLLRATLAAADLLPNAAVVAAPLASRGPGRASDDHSLGEIVTSAYAAGDVFAVPGDGELPDEVAAVVDAEILPPSEIGLVLFFTGLSGSGKSTLARALTDVVLERGERTITSLDGDVVRRNLSAGLTFSKADRETNIRRIGWVAAEISRHRGLAICSPIAPFDETRQQVRAMVDAAGGVFFLIHVATPVEECERRDRKGLYARARRGEIPEFTGISSPYEEPADADVRVDTTGRSIEDCLAEVLDALDESGYLPHPSGERAPGVTT
ncbi:adenylyl-sulfate kinase [Nocardioides sp. HDW12B]|uniref:adenylyl-sulfate kinase n=1 Tax=Nocardioides sp. HDW12B TaxID=2714939 RepID=UPI001980BD02|nr:adenylyl-sulfate kinase [Nocardioides sp. HDW12B]